MCVTCSFRNSLLFVIVVYQAVDASQHIMSHHIHSNGDRHHFYQAASSIYKISRKRRHQSYELWSLHARIPPLLRYPAGNPTLSLPPLTTAYRWSWKHALPHLRSLTWPPPCNEPGNPRYVPKGPTDVVYKLLTRFIGGLWVSSSLNLVTVRAVSDQSALLTGNTT